MVIKNVPGLKKRRKKFGSAMYSIAGLRHGIMVAAFEGGELAASGKGEAKHGAVLRSKALKV